MVSVETRRLELREIINTLNEIKMKEKNSQSGSLRDKWGQKWKLYWDKREQLV